VLRPLIARLATAALVLLGVSLTVFVLTRVIPGDPVEVIVGEMASPADRLAVARAAGLDKPLGAQLVDYYSGLIRLDLGESIFSGEPVTSLLLKRLPATAELALAGLLVAVLLALPLGILAALRPGSRIDLGAMGFSLVGVSMPNFWLGPLLILLFSIELGWLPVSGRGAPGALVLPALTLGTALAAILSRMVRASLLEVLGADFIRTARAKGLGQLAATLRHALPNALLPVITVLGLQLGALLSGAVITEMIFSWPGLGELTVTAIQKRDYAVVQGCVLLISAAYVGVNTLTDLLYGVIDPRTRTADESA